MEEYQQLETLKENVSHIITEVKDLGTDAANADERLDTIESRLEYIERSIQIIAAQGE